MLDFTMDGEVQKHRKQLVAKTAARQTVSITQYRDLVRRYNRFLARYDDLKNQLQCYRMQCQDLECELRAIRPEVYQAYQKIDRQEKRLNKLEAENILLRKELAGIKEKLHQQPKVPAFVKANVSPDQPRLRPGRKVGHAPALRPLPEKIDAYIEVYCGSRKWRNGLRD